MIHVLNLHPSGTVDIAGLMYVLTNAHASESSIIFFSFLSTTEGSTVNVQARHKTNNESMDDWLALKRQRDLRHWETLKRLY